MIGKDGNGHFGDFGLTIAEANHVRTFKVPVTDLYPSYFYVASLSSSSTKPTDKELRQLRSFIEFSTRRTYNEYHARKMLEEMDFAGDGGHNTIIFLKGGLWKESAFPHEGWTHRRATWEHGPLLFPSRTDPQFRPWSLAKLLDHIEGEIDNRDRPNDKWAAWKTSHPKVFA